MRIFFISDLLLIHNMCAPIPSHKIQLCIISTPYQKLCDTRIADSNWQPFIFVDISSPPHISTNTPDCVDVKQPSKTNIVPLMNKQVQSSKQYLSININIQKMLLFALMGIMALMIKKN